MEYKNAEVARRDYGKKKQDILKLLEDTISFYRESENDEEKNINAFISLKDDLEKGEFSIVVVGEFSAGKSTLLNALMRKRILPSFTNETTATVNFLRHKENALNNEAGKVFYKSGKVEEIDVLSSDTIDRYVSTRGEDVANSIEHLDLYLDSKFLEDGVTLVDSPGLNGIAAGHKEITEQQILKSHASIFLFNSDHPGSKTDFEFLGELRKKVKTIIFVLNKIDIIKEDEGETVESVIETLKQNYKKQFPEEEYIPEIWPVSSYQALCARTIEENSHLNENGKDFQKAEEKRFQKFENRLLNFLTCGEKARQQLLAPLSKMEEQLKDSKAMLEKEKGLLEGSESAEDIKKEIEQVQKEQEGISKRIGDNQRKIQRKIKEIYKKTIENLEADLEKLKDSRIKKIEDEENFDELLDELGEFEKTFKEKMKNVVEKESESFSEDMEEMIDECYSESSETIRKNMEEISANITFVPKKHLDISKLENLEFGLRELENRRRECEMEMAELEKEYNEATQIYWKKKGTENKLKKLQEELEDLKDSKEKIMKRTLPDVKEKERIVTERKIREGLWGILKTIAVGREEVKRIEKFEDRTEYEAAKAKQQEDISDKEKEIEEKEKDIRSKSSLDIDVELEELEQNRDKIKKMQIKKEQDLREIIEDGKEELDRRNQSNIKKCKRKINDFCDECIEEVEESSRRQFKELEKLYTKLVINVIAGKLKSELEDKKEQYRKLEEKVKDAKANKDEAITRINERLQQIERILEEASDLSVSIEYEETDTIKQDRI